MIRIESYDGESIKSLLRRFKKSCEKEGLIRDIKRHEAYEKPSDQQRRDKIRIAKNAKKNQAMKSQKNPKTFIW